MKKIDLSKIETWAHGLFAAIIIAAANTGGAVLTSFGTGSPINWHQLLVSMGISALIAAFFYLKQSPLPDIEETVVDLRQMPPPSSPPAVKPSTPDLIDK
jgi:hypothetical protein